MDERRMEDLIKSRRYIDAELKVLSECLGFSDREDSEKRIGILRKKLSLIDSCLMILSAEDAFIVKRHLVDALDWSRVMIEYSQLWGTEQERSERSLKRKQANAISKMTSFFKAQLSDKDIV